MMMVIKVTKVLDAGPNEDVCIQSEREMCGRALYQV